MCLISFSCASHRAVYPDPVNIQSLIKPGDKVKIVTIDNEEAEFEVVEVTDEDAIETTRQLGRDYGLLVGISSGANIWAAREVAKKYKGNITTVLPDRAERYFSTALL